MIQPARSTQLSFLVLALTILLSACVDVTISDEKDRTRVQVETSRQIKSIQIVGPTTIQEGHCVPYEIGFLDGGGRFIAPEEEIHATLTGLRPQDRMFVDRDCTDELDPLNFVIPPNRSIIPAFIQPGAPGPWPVRHSVVTLESGVFATIEVEVTAEPEAPASIALSISPDSTVVAGDSAVLFVELLAEDGSPAFASEDMILNLGGAFSQLLGSFCADAACLSPLADHQLHVPAGQSGVTLFYEPHIHAPSISVEIYVSGHELEEVFETLHIEMRQATRLHITGGPVEGFVDGVCAMEKVRVSFVDDNLIPVFQRGGSTVRLSLPPEVEVRDECADTDPRSKTFHVNSGVSFVEFNLTPVGVDTFPLTAIDARLMGDTKVFLVGTSPFEGFSLNATTKNPLTKQHNKLERGMNAMVNVSFPGDGTSKYRQAPEDFPFQIGGSFLDQVESITHSHTIVEGSGHVRFQIQVKSDAAIGLFNLEITSGHRALTTSREIEITEVRAPEAVSLFLPLLDGPRVVGSCGGIVRARPILVGADGFRASAQIDTTVSFSILEGSGEFRASCSGPAVSSVTIRAGESIASIGLYLVPLEEGPLRFRVEAPGLVAEDSAVIDVIPSSQ